MEQDDFSQVDPVSLSGLMACGADDQQWWSTKELKAILEHQLAADLQFDLEQLDEAVGLDLPVLLRSEPQQPIRSFGDLFQHPQPPIELLNLTRRLAKVYRSQADSPVPSEIATIVYLSSIAAAVVRLDQRITCLENEAICNAFRWALKQDWLDGLTRQLLERGHDTLRSELQTDG